MRGGGLQRTRVAQRVDTVEFCGILPHTGGLKSFSPVPQRLPQGFFARLLKKMGNLGKKIRAVRKKSGMSQSELSRRVKTPRTHIVAIEKGRRGIGLALLSRISLVLGVQINFFLDRAQVEGAKIAHGTKPRIRSL